MKELMKKSHERENQEMNDKIAVCLGKGGQRDMAEAFCRRTGAQLQDKLGDFLTVRFDSRGVSLSGFGLTYQGDFVETMLHRVTRGRLQHEMLVKAVKSDKEGRKAIDATAGMGEDAFLLAAQGYEVTLYEQNPVIAAAEIRKEAKEKEAERCRELRDYLYEDFREGIISKEDYKELHDGYTEKRKKAEEAVRSIDQQISEVMESKSDKYHWLDYFAEHQNIQELTRTVAVELIDQILVYDKKHIEVRFNFDDCYQSLLRQIQSVGCDVSTGMDGRIEIQKREVV